MLSGFVSRWVRFAIVLLILLAPAMPASAQDGSIRLGRSQALQFADKTIKFSLSAVSPAMIDRVVLVFGITRSGCTQGEIRVDPDFISGMQVDAHFDWKLGDYDAFLPGLEIWWQWEISDAAGNQLKTDKQTAILQDPAFSWQKLEQGQITLYWTDNEIDFGKRLMDMAARSLDRLSAEAGVEIAGENPYHNLPYG